MPPDKIAVRLYWSTTESPLGMVYSACTDAGLCQVAFGLSEQEFLNQISRLGVPVADSAAHALFRCQLDEYFLRERGSFDLPLDLRWSTPFQYSVYNVVLQIPCGQTMTYAVAAEAVGRPRAYRAVGAANGQNPLPLVVPCHRLIGSDGKMHGYGAGQGIETKRWLLEFEGAM